MQKTGYFLTLWLAFFLSSVLLAPDEIIDEQDLGITIIDSCDALQINNNESSRLRLASIWQVVAASAAWIGNVGHRAAASTLTDEEISEGQKAIGYELNYAQDMLQRLDLLQRDLDYCLSIGMDYQKEPIAIVQMALNKKRQECLDVHNVVQALDIQAMGQNLLRRRLIDSHYALLLKEGAIAKIAEDVALLKVELRYDIRVLKQQYLTLRGIYIEMRKNFVKALEGLALKESQIVSIERYENGLEQGLHGPLVALNKLYVHLIDRLSKGQDAHVIEADIRYSLMKLCKKIPDFTIMEQGFLDQCAQWAKQPKSELQVYCKIFLVAGAHRVNYPVMQIVDTQEEVLQVTASANA